VAEDIKPVFSIAENLERTADVEGVTEELRYCSRCGCMTWWVDGVCEWADMHKGQQCAYCDAPAVAWHKVGASVCEAHFEMTAKDLLTLLPRVTRNEGGK